MKTEYREHPLGTPGERARRMARSLEPGHPFLRFLSTLFPGLRGAGSSWEKGAVGEEAVGRSLDKLPRDKWLTLHDRPLGTGGRNVDHLVIGPGGVFSVNTKNLSGKVVVKPNAFLVNGFPDRCLHVARDEAARVSERLTLVSGEPVEVHAVIVVLTPELRVEAQPEGVHLLGARDVPGWFRARPSTLDPRMSNRIYEAARAGRTWSEDVAALRAGVPGLTAKVWRRPGQDRVYVNDANGETLGHLDRKTGEIHAAIVERSDELRAALAPYVSK